MAYNEDARIRLKWWKQKWDDAADKRHKDMAYQFDISQPFRDVVEASLVRYVVHHYNTHCPTIIWRRYCMESFLSSRIPAAFSLFYKQDD